jgi:hypothetical protein
MLTLRKEVEVMVQTVIVADDKVIKSILAILTLLYAIIQVSRPVLLFAYDVFIAVNYSFKMVSIIINSVLYGMT